MELTQFLISEGYDSEFAEEIYQVYTLHIGNWKQAIEDTFEELNGSDEDWPAEIINDIEEYINLFKKETIMDTKVDEVDDLVYFLKKITIAHKGADVSRDMKRFNLLLKGFCIANNLKYAN